MESSINELIIRSIKLKKQLIDIKKQKIYYRNHRLSDEKRAYFENLLKEITENINGDKIHLKQLSKNMK